MALQRRISRRRNRRLIGREYQVLIEGPSKETELLWEARLSTQAPEIDGLCYVNDFGPDEEAPRPGEMRQLRVTAAHDYDLVGALVDSAESSFASHRENGANPFPILQVQPRSAPHVGAIPVR